MARITVLLLGALASAPVFAATGKPAPGLAISGNLALISDYRFRGISLSDREPAFQGGVIADHDSGFYAGAWASTVDGFGELGGSNLEVDLTGGYRHGRGRTSFDAGLLYYAYPGSSGDFEFFEPYASVSRRLGQVTAKLGVAFAPRQRAIGGRSNVYVSGDVGLAVKGAPIVLKAHAGRSQGETTLSPGGGYSDWSFGMEAARRRFTFSLTYVDTSIGDAAARRAGANRRDVAASVVVSAAASF